MSYAISSALQSAVYLRLAGDTALTAMVGSAIYDALPAGPLPTTYVALGPEEVRDRSDKTGAGASHEFTVSVVTEATGFQDAKEAAGAISDALHHADLPLDRGQLVAMNFLKASARREGAGTLRRIDLKFRAIVSDA